jgi:hypothetical protein
VVLLWWYFLLGNGRKHNHQLKVTLDVISLRMGVMFIMHDSHARVCSSVAL